ncbi:MAG: MarR family winged helix-turn-helix transcriptional regulator [Actinomycetota bacterium]|nr:MarR family winged helix-turn-helix transcriptional regulator [Actinomycetota bacterium]
MADPSTRQDADNRADAVDRRGSRTPAGDAFSAAVVRLIRLHGFLTAAGDALAKPAGQTSARWQVLAAIEDEPRSVAKIAQLLVLARQSVQRVADILESEGLVVYEANPRHRRAKLVRLTPKGRRTLTKIQDAQRGWADTLGAELGAENLERLTKQLDDLFSAVERHRPA